MSFLKIVSVLFLQLFLTSFVHSEDVILSELIDNNDIPGLSSYIRTHPGQDLRVNYNEWNLSALSYALLTGHKKAAAVLIKEEKSINEKGMLDDRKILPLELVLNNDNELELLFLMLLHGVDLSLTVHSPYYGEENLWFNLAQKGIMTIAEMETLMPASIRQ